MLDLSCGLETAIKLTKRISMGLSDIDSLSHSKRNCKYHIVFAPIPELKYKYRNREFWCKGYYVLHCRKNEGIIVEYIKQQLEEDKFGTQLSMPDLIKKRKTKHTARR